MVNKLIFLFKKKEFIIISLYLALYLSSIILIITHKNDTEFSNNWIIFYMWLLLFSFSLVFIILQIPRIITKIIDILKQDIIYILIIFFLALLTRFFLLKTYPFLINGDGLRDAGLLGLKIRLGNLKDIFDFGSYQGYGNFIPLISYYFSHLLQNSILIFRLPSAIVGIFSIIVTYFITRFIVDKKTAFLSSIFLMVSLTHLHYSRTELLVIMDSLLSLIVISAFYVALKDKKGFFAAGLITGFALHFYAGIRGIIFIFILYIALKVGKNLVENFRLNIKKTIFSVLLFVIGFVIGTGPTINFIKEKIISDKVGTATFFLSTDEFKQKPIKEKIVSIYDLYEKNFLVYIFQPISGSHFYYRTPLLSFPLNWLFLLGLFYILFFKLKKGNSMINLITFVIFLFPVTNGVFQGQVGVEHRMMGIVPFINIIAAFGVNALSELIGKKLIWKVVLLGTSIFIIIQYTNYIIKRPSEFSTGSDAVLEYSLQESLNNLKTNDQINNYYFLNNQPYNFDFYHYREKMEFFVYPVKADLLEEEEFSRLLKLSGMEQSEDSFFISYKDIPNVQGMIKRKYSVECPNISVWPQFNCPKDFIGEYSYYYFYLR